MPDTTQERLRQRTAALKKKLADGRGSMDQAKVRALRKKIRRTQRRRRRDEARSKRLAGAAEAKAE